MPRRVAMPLGLVEYFKREGLSDTKHGILRMVMVGRSGFAWINGCSMVRESGDAMIVLGPVRLRSDYNLL